MINDACTVSVLVTEQDSCTNASCSMLKYITMVKRKSFVMQSINQHFSFL